MGLRIMRYRAALIQATLEIEPVDKGGTLVMCVLTDVETLERRPWRRRKRRRIRKSPKS